MVWRGLGPQANNVNQAVMETDGLLESKAPVKLLPAGTNVLGQSGEEVPVATPVDH